MLIRCINRPFQDLVVGVWRKVGDEWEGTPERVAEINRAGYGVMAEAVEPTAETPAEQPAEPTAEVAEPTAETPETAPEPRAATTRAKGAAARRKPRKSAQEG